MKYTFRRGFLLVIWFVSMGSLTGAEAIAEEALPDLPKLSCRVEESSGNFLGYSDPPQKGDTLVLDLAHLSELRDTIRFTPLRPVVVPPYIPLPSTEPPEPFSLSWRDRRRLEGANYSYLIDRLRFRAGSEGRSSVIIDVDLSGYDQKAKAAVAIVVEAPLTAGVTLLQCRPVSSMEQGGGTTSPMTGGSHNHGSRARSRKANVSRDVK